ncbi:MAG: DHHA1 domain-containing protein, partial [Candidatus Thermochlorobacter sp.]
MHIIDRILNNASQQTLKPNEFDLSDLPDELEAQVDAERRYATMVNHTATHLLHAALRKVLGEHVQQKGSLVTPERLRFDFSHFEKVSDEQLAQIERMVNEQIRSAKETIKHENIPFEEAKRMGALAFFGDKYGERVRVLEIPAFSIEFCGGTHLDNIGQIGLFKIISESSIASGVRRVEAITGKAAEELFRTEFVQLQSLRQMLNVSSDSDAIERVKKLLEEKRAMEKQVEKLRLEAARYKLNDILDAPEHISDVEVVAREIDWVQSVDELQGVAELARQQLKSGAALLGSVIDGKVSLVAIITDDLIEKKKLHAGKLIGD